MVLVHASADVAQVYAERDIAPLKSCAKSGRM